jgi:hypothetical protein
MNDDYTQEDLNNDLQVLIKLGLIEEMTLEGGVPAYRITQKAQEMDTSNLRELIEASLEE